MTGLILECTARSDVGRRSNDDDTVFAGPRLAAVADGVGGAAAGEVASRTLINALVHVGKCRLEGRLEDAIAAGIAPDVVDDDTIAATLPGAPRAHCAQRLIDLALAEGGRDNVSAIVADVAPRVDPSTSWQ